MGTIKLELVDLPEFEKELSINITIHRDGEVVYNTTSSPSMGSKLLDIKGSNPETNAVTSSVDGRAVSGRIIEEKNEVTTNISSPEVKKKSNKKCSGNFMDLDI